MFPAIYSGKSKRCYVVFTDHAVDSTDLTTYTFTSRFLGAARANRRIVVAVSTRQNGGTPVVSSLTVAGISATLVKAQTVQSGFNDVELWIADVRGGTSGTIVVTLDEASSRCGIGVWALYGAGSSTASDTDSASATDPLTVTLTVPARGAAIAATVNLDATTCRGSWSGLTENYDDDIEATVGNSGACMNSKSGGNISMSWDANNNGTTQAAVFASWGP